MSFPHYSSFNANNNNNSNTISIKDRHFIAAWSAADAKKIDRYTEMITSLYGKPAFEDRYHQLAELMISLIERRHNDHHNAIAELGHDWLKVEPINSPTLEEDMCTFTGINKLLKIYNGTASGIFKYVGRGAEASTVTPYLIGLASETGSRQDATSTGFHEIKGVSLRILSSFVSSIASENIYQIGVFDASSTGIMLAIHDFGNNGFSHVQNDDAFTLGMVIDFVVFGDV